MKFSQAKQGRVFVLKLEQGDLVREEIEKFAQENSIKRAQMIIHGGIDKGSSFVVGQKDGSAEKLTAMRYTAYDLHEVTGTGTLFPNEEGKPLLHMHLSCGRDDIAITGCVREGVKTWRVLEIVITELIDSSAVRKSDSKLGFAVLEP